ncbi:hypothetical protein E2C01_040396 [Portunus trituberculatus]|uniref:Uncharacterized protein n=1 Tax=Portunus trituberculatus TaxID=210409 RepID=A0A5B7FHE5_PORTR|nr:hypothetical protein [Portunus trituberculatus]
MVGDMFTALADYDSASSTRISAFYSSRANKKKTWRSIEQQQTLLIHTHRSPVGACRLPADPRIRRATSSPQRPLASIRPSVRTFVASHHRHDCRSLRRVVGVLTPEPLRFSQCFVSEVV